MQQFIEPKTLARIKDLPLIAKTVAEGFLYGLQSSMQRGVGIEFNQYRAYEIGDELNRIDWKLFARSDRYFVREAKRESEIDVWFLLDASRSMLQSSSRESNVSGKQSLKWNKLDYAKYLIASLGYLSQKQGDVFGYINLSDTKNTKQNSLPCGNGEKHWQKLLLSLARTQPGVFFPKPCFLQKQIEQLQRPSVIFLISDFNQQNNEIIEFLEKLNSSRSEVVAMQLTSDDELEFNYNGAIRFRDLETRKEMLVSASSVKKTYLANYQQYQDNLKRNLTEKNINIERFNIDQPLDSALFSYLRQRHRVAK